MTLIPAFDPADPLHVLIAASGFVILALLLLLALIAGRSGRAAQSAALLQGQLDELRRGQAALTGAHLNSAQHLDARVTALTTDMGESLADSATRTAHSLGALQEKLAAIDRAQANIERLSGDVLGLQDILSNKQARGAFGEIQLHDLLANALPREAWRWQATLPSGVRADCVIDLPDPPGSIVIDAKFPLEGYEALQSATTDTERRSAERAFRTAIRAHIAAISTKYIIPGETAESALMFLPSEAVFAELHARFPEMVREGFAARVWIVSPSTCMALLNTVRAVLKDVRLRDEARALREALSLLDRDLSTVAQRAGKLRTHFAQSQNDIEALAVAAERALQRSERIDRLRFDDGGPPPADHDLTGDGAAQRGLDPSKRLAVGEERPNPTRRDGPLVIRRS